MPKGRRWTLDRNAQDRRNAFVQGRESSIGTMMLMETMDDVELSNKRKEG